MQHAILEGGVVRWGMRVPPIGEAASTTAAAQLARPKPHDEDVPVAAFVKDLKRKVKLKKVMGRPNKNKFHRSGLSEQEEPLDQFPKEDVNYRYSGKPDFKCGVCRYFIEPGACQIVNGLIRPVDVCDKFEPRAAGGAAAGSRAVLAEVLVEAQVAGDEDEVGTSAGAKKGWLTRKAGGSDPLYIPQKAQQRIGAELRRGDRAALRAIQRRRQAAKDTARGMNADEAQEHVQDPSGKWVPTPGEGGPGAPRGEEPEEPRGRSAPSMLDVKKRNREFSDAPASELRDVGYRRRADFVNAVMKRHGGAVGDQAASLLGMPSERDRFYARWAPKKRGKPGDQNPNALRMIGRMARQSGYDKFSSQIDQYLQRRGQTSEADVSDDEFDEQGAPAYPTSGGLNLGALGPLVRSQSAPLPSGGMNRESEVIMKMCREAHCFARRLVPPAGVKPGCQEALARFRRDAGGRIAAVKAAVREVSPPGWEGTVKRMKGHPEVTNPWALAWHMKGKGYTPGYGPRGGKKTALRTVTAEVV